MKALYLDARVLILDEPTVSLTPKETEDLLFTLRTSVKKEDLTIIFITHKFPVALSISDRITVLRKGEIVDTVDAANQTERSLARMMVGATSLTLTGIPITFSQIIVGLLLLCIVFAGHLERKFKMMWEE